VRLVGIIHNDRIVNVQIPTLHAHDVCVKVKPKHIIENIAIRALVLNVTFMDALAHRVESKEFLLVWERVPVCICLGAKVTHGLIDGISNLAECLKLILLGIGYVVAVGIIRWDH
jgi:hypothetical protein